MADDFTPRLDDAAVTGALDRIELRMLDVRRSASAFGRSMSDAFSQSILGSRSFEDVLKSLTLRLSDIALRAAFKPVENALTGGLTALFGGGGGAKGQNFFEAASGAIKPFASGGVIGTPTYFPLRSGGLGLAGEAGPEAILPLSRGPDGRLGISAQGGAGAGITVNIATPDAQSFRRSEVYVTGQIARAVARGQRGL
jgi:phage-related minor tail protein